MKYRCVANGPERTYVVVCDMGDEVMRELKKFAEDEELGASRFEGVGAFGAAKLGWWSWQGKAYSDIEVHDQVELLSMSGDITLAPDGRVKVHAHVVCGRHDGSTIGGHLQEGWVRPTLELVVVESPPHLRRRHDPETGLALIDLDTVDVTGKG